MFKKKTAKYSVSIPYELRDNQLWIRTIAWPQQCPCCNEKDVAALGIYEYTHKARYWQASTGSQTTTSSYPLDWQVPYCVDCLEHVKKAENWKYGLIAIVIFVPIVLALVIDPSADLLILLLYAVFIVGGLALYRIIVETVIKPGLRPTCQDYSYVIWADSPPTEEHKVVFNFDGDEYAQMFAMVNSAVLESNS